jgi:hypothetical protein
MASSDKSDYAFLKENGFDGSQQHFNQVYGLNIIDDDQLEEGKAILEGLRDIEQRNWESGRRSNRILEEAEATEEVVGRSQ